MAEETVERVRFWQTKSLGQALIFGRETAMTDLDLDALEGLLERATKGPWPISYTGDGKRIVIGEGLVEGPGGYEVAEVYSDDCPQDLAEANAGLIAAAVNALPALIAIARRVEKMEAWVEYKLVTARRDTKENDHPFDYGWQAALEATQHMLANDGGDGEQ